VFVDDFQIDVEPVRQIEEPGPRTEPRGGVSRSRASANVTHEPRAEVTISSERAGIDIRERRPRGCRGQRSTTIVPIGKSTGHGARAALMATRTYSGGNRQFVMTLVGTPAGSYSSWTVESVRDAMTGDGVPVPGLQNIVASDEDAAFARVCDRIDSWLKLKP
jgi:hypothetical protein